MARVAGVRTVYRARWLLTGEGEPVPDGAIAIRDGRIEAAGSARDVARDGRAVDLGDAAILPGFVNAHAHLELSGMRGQIPADGGFCAWVRRIVDRKRTMTDADLTLAVETGISEIVRNGFTTVADHATRGLSYGPLCESGVRGTSLIEFTGFALTPAGTEECLRMVESRLAACPDTDRVRMGLAPHSPYALLPDLIRRAGERARAERRTLSIHLSEVLEEIAFLRTGTGPIREFLEYRGVLGPEWTPPRQSPTALAESLGVLRPGTLAVHMNYLETGDLDRLHAGGAAVVYCPNSHAFFGHPPHPFGRYLDLGIRAALGTDSLASNASLSPWEELRTARARFPAIPAPTLLRVASLGGGRALGLDARIGTLSPGKEADFIAARVPEGIGAGALEEHLVSSAPAVLLTVVAGRVLHDGR